MSRYFYLLFIAILFFNCTKENKPDVDVSGIDVNFNVERFDQAYYTSKPEQLQALKEKFPYLFPVQTPDSIWIAKINDPDEQELFAESQKRYSGFEAEKAELTDLFKHIKYYYPAFKAPEVITLLSNVDYENRVVYADSLLLISLDNYLGSGNKIYDDFPEYIKNKFNRDRIVVDVAEAIGSDQIPRPSTRSFVSNMVQAGKKKYLLDAYMPRVADSTKMGYSGKQIAWAEQNAGEVWKYFVQNKLLFSTDQELDRRFIDEAPFSKFYMENDNETPGSIGVWFGWQIVRAYMQNNESTLEQMLSMNNEDLFNRSKFKPNR